MASSPAFELALSFTLRIETGDDPDGAYNDRPADRGGPTKYGISQRAYPHLNIRDLTREQAVEIYRSDYWSRARCSELPAPIAIAHFDAAVHHGVARAGKIMQATVGAHADGDVGLRTLAALMSFRAGRGDHVAAAAIVETRARFLCRLVDEPDEADQLANLAGWVVRLVRLSAYVSRSHP